MSSRVTMAFSVVGIAAGLAACGSSHPTPPDAKAAPVVAPTPTTSTTPTPSPSPTQLTIKEAATRYLAIDTAYERYRKRLQADLGTNVNYAKVRKDGAAAEKALAKKIADMINTPWPSSVQKYADSYETKAAVGVNLFRDVSHVHNLSDLVNATSGNNTTAINGAEALLRIKLGLPQAK